MFLPVLSSEDGYGLTYGARFALPDPNSMGKHSRIAFPLTLGRHQTGCAEIEKTFDTRP